MITSLTPKQVSVIQADLVEIHQQIKQTFYASGLPAHACFHFAPDGCWVSIEHEYSEQPLPNAQSPHDFVVVCVRKPAMCHEILVKI